MENTSNKWPAILSILGAIILLFLKSYNEYSGLGSKGFVANIGVVAGQLIILVPIAGILTSIVYLFGAKKRKFLVFSVILLLLSFVFIFF